MPLDETTTNTDDAPASNLGQIWSSIGPGGRHSVADDSGPPTIRPDDHAAWPEASPPTGPSSMSSEKVDPPVTESDDPSTPSTSTTEQKVSQGLRDELRVGVRMIKALDAQLKQAEASIRRHEEATRRAEEVRLDPREIERTTNESLRRITSLAEQMFADLERRLARQAEMDTRLDELDAALATVERQITRITTAPESSPPGADHIRSGSLAVDDHESATAPSEPGGSIDALTDRAEGLRRELRADLEAICSASASLAEIVDRANQTESILRGTLETTRAADAPSPERGQTIATVLRRLADEIDHTPPADRPVDARNSPRRLAGIDLPRPVVLDLATAEDATQEAASPPEIPTASSEA